MSESLKVVLIVDDNLANRELLARTLSDRYETAQAQDGLEALAILEVQTVDAIVSDILMPNLDGYALCRAVRRCPELEDVFFILYTATNFSADDERLGLECGADKFVNKQGTPKVILHMIDEVMKLKREDRVRHVGAPLVSAADEEMKRYNSRIIRQLEENSFQVEQARDELRDRNGELEKSGAERAAQLAIANKRLEFLNEELEQRVSGRTVELAAKNKELARSNADLEQFAYAASHDLQEPLRAVSGCVQLFARKYRGQADQKADQLVDMIVSGAARMQALINAILAYSRAGQAANLETIDSGAVLKCVLADLQVALEESQTEVVFTTLPSIRFAKTQFEQLLRNLIGNAIKYRKTIGQKVHIQVERQINSWIFSVTDEGIGFEQQYAAQVFGIFQRLHTRDQYLGAGIGLSISKKIIESRGGTIWAQSIPDHGSSFFFSVPDSPEL
jgi:signal transduction histidine kinase